MCISSIITFKKYIRYSLSLIAFFSFNMSECQGQMSSIPLSIPSSTCTAVHKTENPSELIKALNENKENSQDSESTSGKDTKNSQNSENTFDKDKNNSQHSENIPNEKKENLQNPENASNEKKENSQPTEETPDFFQKIAKTFDEKQRKPFSEQMGYLEKMPSIDLKIQPLDTESSFTLSELQNNVVILFFTTTWCPNCPSVFTDLEVLQKKLTSLNITNVRIITLILDHELLDNAVRIYYKAHNISELKAYKPISPNVLKSNDIIGVPTCLIVNKKGEFVWGYSGIANYQSQEFLDYVLALANE